MAKSPTVHLVAGGLAPRRVRLHDDARALGFGDADPGLLQARSLHLAGHHRFHTLTMRAVVRDLDLVALDKSFHHLEHGEVRAVELTYRDRHVLELLRFVDAGPRIDHDGKARHRGAERHDLGGPQVLFLDRLNRTFHDTPFAHAELVALALVIGRFQAALEDVVLQGAVVGIVLTASGRDQDVDFETLVAEEALIARDQQRQVVDRVHHRGFDFLKLGHGVLPKMIARTFFAVGVIIRIRSEFVQTSVNLTRNSAKLDPGVALHERLVDRTRSLRPYPAGRQQRVNRSLSGRLGQVCLSPGTGP